MTHSALVKRAARWLEISRRCRVVVTDGFTSVSEMPDAIGWDSALTTILVECKTSRADFLRDAKKYTRRVPGLGMGRERWFLAPPGIIKPAELPDGWGLLEAQPSRLARAVNPKPFEERNTFAEARMLYTLSAQSQAALGDLNRAWRRMGR